MSRLDLVRYEVGIAKAHYDIRRNIDDPIKLLEGLEGTWYAHSVHTLNKSCIELIGTPDYDEKLELAKHHHNFNEVFFSPNGGFTFALADINDPNEIRTYTLEKGSRLYLPIYTAHLALGLENSVLLGFGDVPFDPKKLIPSDPKLIEKLREELFKKLRKG